MATAPVASRSSPDDDAAAAGARLLAGGVDAVARDVGVAGAVAAMLSTGPLSMLPGAEAAAAAAAVVVVVVAAVVVTESPQVEDAAAQNAPSAARGRATGLRGVVVFVAALARARA
jgi:hypothetical protein